MYVPTPPVPEPKAVILVFEAKPTPVNTAPIYREPDVTLEMVKIFPEKLPVKVPLLVAAYPEKLALTSAGEVRLGPPPPPEPPEVPDDGVFPLELPAPPPAATDPKAELDTPGLLPIDVGAEPPLPTII